MVRVTVDGFPITVQLLRSKDLRQCALWLGAFQAELASNSLAHVNELVILQVMLSDKKRNLLCEFRKNGILALRQFRLLVCRSEIDYIFEGIVSWNEG